MIGFNLYWYILFFHLFNLNKEKLDFPQFLIHKSMLLSFLYKIDFKKPSFYKNSPPSPVLYKSLLKLNRLTENSPITQGT